MNAVLRLLKECRQYLPKEYKTKGVLIVGLILLSTFVDLFGIATVFPLFNVFLSDTSFENPLLKALYDFVGADDQRQFMFILMALVTVVLILKTAFISFSSFIQGRFIYSIYAYYVRQKYLSIFVSKGDLEVNQNSDDLKSDLYILPRVFANQLLTALLNVIAETFILIIVFVALLIYNWKIVSILLVTIVPLLMLFYYGIRKKNESVDVELKDYLSKISRSVTVAYFGNTDIKLSGTFDFFYNKFRRTIASESLLLNWKLLLTKIPALVVELIILFALIIMIVSNLLFDNSREVLILQISIFGVAAIKLMPSINRLMYAIMNIQANLYSIEILKERVNASEITASSGNVSFEKNIEISNAGFSYDGRRKVFDNLGLTITKGDRIGIIGESGSGKSTMLKLFLGHLKLQSGTFTVDGRLIDKTNLSTWHHMVGMVGQDVFILDDTLEANIAFGHEAVDERRLSEAIELAALSQFVAALPRGVKTHLGEMGSLISGGQRQRIAIARALYHEAQLLLLDEVTSSLDEKTEEVILQSIQKLPPSLTIVTITHRMSFLGFCNKIFELKNGVLKQITV